MKISIKVKTSSKQAKIIKTNDNYIVWVKEAAKEGKANKAVIKLMAKYLKLPQSSLIIKSGLKFKSKILQIIC